MKENKKSIIENKCISNIECNIIYEKIKNAYIQIKDGKVTIKVPKNKTDAYIENIINERKNWILKKLKEQENTKYKKSSYKDGDIIYVLGKPYTLKVIYTENKKQKIYQDNKYLYCELTNNKELSLEDEEKALKTLIDKYYKFIATQEVPPAMEDIEQRTGLHPQEFTIKNLKAAWGICSSKKKISINQNLMAYSRHAIEYVCLHEICHLKHMNHSKEFWNMVEYYLPDYKLAKKELKG